MNRDERQAILVDAAILFIIALIIVILVLYLFPDDDSNEKDTKQTAVDTTKPVILVVSDDTTNTPNTTIALIVVGLILFFVVIYTSFHGRKHQEHVTTLTLIETPPDDYNCLIYSTQMGFKSLSEGKTEFSDKFTRFLYENPKVVRKDLVEFIENKINTLKNEPDLAYSFDLELKSVKNGGFIGAHVWLTYFKEHFGDESSVHFFVKDKNHRLQSLTNIFFFW